MIDDYWHKLVDYDYIISMFPIHTRPTNRSIIFQSTPMLPMMHFVGATCHSIKIGPREEYRNKYMRQS